MTWTCVVADEWWLTWTMIDQLVGCSWLFDVITLNCVASSHRDANNIICYHNNFFLSIPPTYIILNLLYHYTHSTTPPPPVGFIAYIIIVACCVLRSVSYFYYRAPFCSILMSFVLCPVVSDWFILYIHLSSHNDVHKQQYNNNSVV